MKDILDPIFKNPYRKHPGSKVFIKYYNLAFDCLIKELKEIGIVVGFAEKVLIGEVITNLILMAEAQNRILLEGTYWKKDNFKVYSVHKEFNHSYNNHMQSSCDFKIFPLCEYILTLQKRTNQILEKLGLLPQQQVQRDKIKIIEKLKQQLLKVEKNGNEYEVNAVCERSQNV